MIILMKSNDESKLMTEEICRFISERRDKKELALLKDKPKKDKGGINTRLINIANDLLENSDEKLALLIKKKKDKTQSGLEFQQEKYQEILFLLDDFKMDNRLFDITEEYKNTLLELEGSHKPNVWLNQWADKAKDISFATHVGKLTHSSSKSSSIYDNTTSIIPAYLTTNTLTELVVDTATANAASAPAGEILTLQVNHKSLLDYLKENNQSPFEPLSEYQEEIDNWMAGFTQAYDNDKKSSHFLAKQIYFPIGNENYHLLMPLVSSSLAQGLFTRFKDFFNNENTQIREQKNKSKYHEKPAVSYPNRATLNVTGSNHSNASSLNGKRGGKLALLPSLPPKWKSKQQLPLTEIDLFNRQLSYRLREEIKDLQKILLIIKSKEISINKPAMHKAVVLAVNDIADGLFDEAIRINSLSDEIGWTQNSCLPLSQQLLLEPYRDDDIAIESKQQWQAELADDFSYWLNEQLKYKYEKLGLTSIQQALWRDLFKLQLREYIAIQEVEE